MKAEDVENILDFDVPEWNITIREFIYRCLIGMWKDPDFSGKHPGVNSGWDFAIAEVIGRNRPDLLSVVFDEEGYIEDLDYGQLYSLWDTLVKHLLHMSL